jgi:hypothetical protein
MDLKRSVPDDCLPHFPGICPHSSGVNGKLPRTTGARVVTKDNMNIELLD